MRNHHEYQMLVVSDEGEIIISAFAETAQGAKDFLAIEREKHPSALFCVRKGDEVGRPLPMKDQWRPIVNLEEIWKC